MKLDFNFRPAAEMPASEALRPRQVNEMTPADRRPNLPAAPVSELSLLSRRQARLARRAIR